MTAIIEVNGKRAVVKHYHWTSSDAELAELLNGMLDSVGPSGADPNPDETAARAAAEALGGRFISADPVDSEPGVIY